MVRRRVAPEPGPVRQGLIGVDRENPEDCRVVVFTDRNAQECTDGVVVRCFASDKLRMGTLLFGGNMVNKTYSTTRSYLTCNAFFQSP